MTNLRLIQACFVLCIAVLGSCSSDTTIDVNDGVAIRFASSIGRQSRAEIGDLQANGFQVWGIIPNPDSEHQVYMNDVFSHIGGKWVNSTDTRKFWPDETLDFYAIYPPTPAQGNVEISRTAQTITEYIAKGDEDLLYAASINQTKAGHINADRITFTPVNLNFYHALSKIEIKTDEVENSAISVYINKITLRNVAKKASLTIPHSTTEAGQPVPQTLWSTPQQITGDKDYIIYDGSALNEYGYEFGEHEVVHYIYDPDPDYYYENPTVGTPMYVIPQTLTPWQNPEGSFNSDGTYLEIDCRITNKVSHYDGEYVQLWPKNNTPGYAPLAVSLSGDWKPGMKYIYTLVFGRGAGIDPNNPDQPIFIPVSITTTTDGISEENGSLNNSN